MRPLEIVLAFSEVLTFLVLVLVTPRLRAGRWLLTSTLACVPLAAGQVLFEGARWQLVPAYTLSIVFLLATRLQPPSSSTSGRSRPLRRRCVAGLIIILAGAATVLAVALPAVVPVFHFPRPLGPYAIGTLTYHWVDATRSDIFTHDPNDARELMVQIWYPAQADPSAPRAPYVEHPEILGPVARLLHLPDFIFGHLKLVASNATRSALVAPDEPAYPVLIFLSGRDGYRQSNTFQVEELVSRGYIVAGVDQPYASAGVVFPDGRLITMDPRLYDPAHPGHAAFLDGVVPFLAQDVTFVLDRLAALNQTDPDGILTGRLDLQREGMFGVSLGGIFTGEACLKDSRLRACLVMDAFMPADVVRAGLEQPTMWISRDAQSMQREGWTAADIDETQTTMRAVYGSLRADGYLVLVPGMFHPDFTDAPLLSPLSSLVGLSGPLDAQRSHAIVNAYSLAFFDHYLKSQPTPLLAGPATQYPEVLFDSHPSPAVAVPAR